MVWQHAGPPHHPPGPLGHQQGWQPPAHDYGHESEEWRQHHHQHDEWRHGRAGEYPPGPAHHEDSGAFFSKGREGDEHRTKGVEGGGVEGGISGGEAEPAEEVADPTLLTVVSVEGAFVFV